MIKRGIYCIHNSIEYSFDKVIGDRVLITSYDRNDLNNGFVCDLNEDFIKKYGFYCQKIVPKSEITEAYKIETRAIYKGMRFAIMSLDDEFIRIENECSNNPDDETNKQLRSWGFSEFMRDKFSIIFDKYIPTNDSEIKRIEERTEIDINKL